jgi:hypothetical protein
MQARSRCASAPFRLDSRLTAAARRRERDSRVSRGESLSGEFRDALCRRRLGAIPHRSL